MQSPELQKMHWQQGSDVHRVHAGLRTLFEQQVPKEKPLGILPRWGVAGRKEGQMQEMQDKELP